MKYAEEAARYRAFADRLLIAPSSTDPTSSNQFDRVYRVADSVSSQLQEHWQQRHYGSLPDNLRLMTVLACLPSLEAAKSEQPHNRDIAEQVDKNMCAIAKAIISAPHLWLHHDKRVANKHDAKRTNIAGQIAELGILGCLWWAVAHEMRDPQTHIWPATSVQDRPYNTNSGYLSGFDLIMHEPSGDTTKSQRIQVKSSQKPEESPDSYEPGIAIVNVSHLRLRRRSTPTTARFILRLLAEDSHRDIRAINRQIDNQLERARQREKDLEGTSVHVYFGEH